MQIHQGDYIRLYEPAWQSFTIQYAGEFRKEHTKIREINIEKSFNENNEFWKGVAEYVKLCKEFGEKPNGHLSEQIMHMEKSELPKLFKQLGRVDKRILEKLKMIVEVLQKLGNRITKNRKAYSDYVNSIKSVREAVRKETTFVVEQPLQKMLQDLKAEYVNK